MTTLDDAGLTAHGVSLAFGDTQALVEVSFTLRPGSGSR